MDPLLADPARLDRPDTLVRREPFPFLVAHGQLPTTARKTLREAFPPWDEAGFFPWHPDDCGAALNTLIEQLIAPPMAGAIGAHLGIPDLASRPTLVTLCARLNRRHGTIHTDSASKVVTALVYLNEEWPDTSAGCLRFLGAIDDIDATVAPEVKPLYGELAAFRRTDNSFHGHLPWEGERRVIQVAWLVSEAAKARKTRRGRTSRWLKKLVGSLDRRLGAGRDRNASHRD